MARTSPGSGTNWSTVAWCWSWIWAAWEAVRTKTESVRRIVEQYPALRVVIAHLGQITPAVQANPKLLRLWEEQIDLARLPNVWFDCASLPAYLPGEDYPYPPAGQFLRMAIDRIGPEKVMWGSDIPGLAGQMTYLQLVRLGKLHTQFFSPHEQAMFWGGNALHLYR